MGRLPGLAGGLSQPCGSCCLRPHTPPPPEPPAPKCSLWVAPRPWASPFPLGLKSSCTSRHLRALPALTLGWMLDQPLPGRGRHRPLFPRPWAAAGWLEEGPSACWGSVWVLQVTRDLPTRFLTQTTDPILPVLQAGVWTGGCDLLVCVSGEGVGALSRLVGRRSQQSLTQGPSQGASTWLRAHCFLLVSLESSLGSTLDAMCMVYARMS